METEAVIIDDTGEALSPASPRLRARLGWAPEQATHPETAVRRHGFVLVSRLRRTARVALDPGRTRPATLIGLLYIIHSLLPDRILLAHYGPQGVRHEIFGDLTAFTVAIETMTEGARARPPYAVVVRSPEDLGLRRFGRFRELIAQWRMRQGVLPDDPIAYLERHSVGLRSVITRNPPFSERLVYEYCGAGFKSLGPCGSLAVIGRDVGYGPDEAFGARIAESYHSALTRQEMRVESVDALLLLPGGGRTRSHFDRLLLPWRDADGRRFIIGVSEVHRRSMLG